MAIIQTLGLIDIGAGSGAKLLVVGEDGTWVHHGFLPVQDYGRGGVEFMERLADCVTGLAGANRLKALAIAVPGFPSGDTVLGCSNLPMLSGYPLAAALRQRLGVPVHMLNDGDAGGLGEWSVRRHELVYWALGGGWGGSWVSAEGAVRFPSAGNEADMHISAEPGHLSRFDHAEVCRILEKSGVPSIWLPHVASMPVEYLVSGPGRMRLFTGASGVSEARAFPPGEDPGVVLSMRHRQGDECARRIDTIFGTLLGVAAARILRTINREAGHDRTPVYVGGGVAQALDLFLPHAADVLRQEGVRNPVLASSFLSSGGNANLAGARLILDRGYQGTHTPLSSTTEHIGHPAVVSLG